MERRRRKDEPFNPFAPNASAKARVRRQQAQHRDNVRQGRPEPEEKSNSQAELAAKQKAAIDAIRSKQEEIPEEEIVVEKKVEPEPIITEIPEIVSESEVQEIPEPIVKKQKAMVPKPRSPPKSKPKKKSNREDRLAALRAKSAATAEFAKQAKESKEIGPADVEAISEEVDVEVEIVKLEESIEPLVEPIAEVISGTVNVFKTIKTEKVKVDRRPKRRRPGDKRGGGRQPQSRKLDRRKYLEYKYAARELLDNDSISEEHRSNVLGQIWAKGERIGIEDAIAFIDLKEVELIITSEIATEFRRMIKRYTTKR